MEIRTVLLADANEEFRGMLREHIEKTEEFRVVGSTGDGAEALELVRRSKPDLLMMDLVLPGLDGFGVLKELGADALICGGIGDGARNALAQAGIDLYPGVTGNADLCAAALANGTLRYDPNTECHHHDHEEGHTCGHHSCG